MNVEKAVAALTDKRDELRERPARRLATVIDLDWPCLVGIVLSAIPEGGIIAISYR